MLNSYTGQLQLSGPKVTGSRGRVERLRQEQAENPHLLCGVGASFDKAWKPVRLLTQACPPTVSEVTLQEFKGQRGPQL